MPERSRPSAPEDVRPWVALFLLAAALVSAGCSSSGSESKTEAWVLADPAGGGLSVGELRDSGVIELQVVDDRDADGRVVDIEAAAAKVLCRPVAKDEVLAQDMLIEPPRAIGPAGRPDPTWDGRSCPGSGE